MKKEQQFNALGHATHDAQGRLIEGEIPDGGIVTVQGQKMKIELDNRGLYKGHVALNKAEAMQAEKQVTGADAATQRVLRRTRDKLKKQIDELMALPLQMGETEEEKAAAAEVNARRVESVKRMKEQLHELDSVIE